MTATLGLPVVYHSHAGHKDIVVGKDKDGKEIRHASVHHPEQHEFHAHVTRVHHDGSADLVFFPPGRDPRHAERVKEGKQPEGDHYWIASDAHEQSIYDALAKLDSQKTARPRRAAPATAGGAGGADTARDAS